MYPECNSDQQLADDFVNFFHQKVHNIREQLDEFPSTLSTESHSCRTFISEFNPVSELTVRKIIMSLPNKSSSLDPIPTSLLKQCVSELLSYICTFINLSLSTGHLCVSLKTAVITPILKKTSLDPVFANYRPISNLPTLSKILEKVVSQQLSTYIYTNNLADPRQSAYRPNHSTELALCRLLNDALVEADRDNVTALLLDLSAAFDTVDHDILLKRLENIFGIHGVPLKWFGNYLKGRVQQVSINNSKSSSIPLLYGVPQGSVLGPLLFCLYVRPLADVIVANGLNHMYYADDLQVTVSFPTCEQEAALRLLHSGLEKIIEWMHTSKLKINNT